MEYYVPKRERMQANKCSKCEKISANREKSAAGWAKVSFCGTIGRIKRGILSNERDDFGTAACLVRPERADAALARHPRPVPHMGQRDDAPADARGDGARVLRALSVALPGCGGAGGGGRSGCTQALGGAGVLFARAESASGGAAGGARLRGRNAARGGAIAAIEGHRGIHRRGDCEHCV